MVCPAAHIKPRGLGGKKKINTRLHHIKEQTADCSHSVSAETYVTFSCFKGGAASKSSSLVYNKNQKVTVPKRESLPALTGSKHFRNPISMLCMD